VLFHFMSAVQRARELFHISPFTLPASIVCGSTPSFPLHVHFICFHYIIDKFGDTSKFNFKGIKVEWSPYTPGAKPRTSV
jgi:hypothetical protein